MSTYVCPQCGLAPEGPEAHAERAHVWPPGVSDGQMPIAELEDEVRRLRESAKLVCEDAYEVRLAYEKARDDIERLSRRPDLTDEQRGYLMELLEQRRVSVWTSSMWAHQPLAAALEQGVREALGAVSRAAAS